MMPSGARESRAFASETKFLIPHATGLAIRDWARMHLERDVHGTGSWGDEYTTSTIYFDTPEYDVFHRRGSFGRSKYRIRRYGDATSVFLERKLRRPGMLTKRRTYVPASSLVHLAQHTCNGWAGGWFHRRIAARRLAAVCQIDYARVARGADGPDGPIRLTLDDQLKVRRIAEPVFAASIPQAHHPSIVEGCMILELKYRGAIPPVFKQLVEEFTLAPQTISKYRLGIAAVDPAGTAAATVEAGVAVPASKPPAMTA